MRKIIHSIQAWRFRRMLVRQRAQNIADLRAGRRAAKAIRREMVRHLRLSSGSEMPRFAPNLANLPCLAASEGIHGGNGAFSGQ